MNGKRRLALCLAALMLLLLCAGCGKAASMKNYRAYASNLVYNSVTDEDARDDMLKIIKGWKKESDYNTFATFMNLFSNGTVKSYSSWVSAGCPTPSPSPKAASTAKSASGTTTSTTTGGGANNTTATSATATPQPVQAQVSTGSVATQSTPAAQSGTTGTAPGGEAGGAGGGGASGESGEPGGTPPT